MAGRGDELNTRLTATDDASKVIDKVAEKVGDLEDRPHEVDIDASKAEREITALDRKFDDLTKEQRVAVLEVQASQAERELKKITRELANADAEDVTIFVEARDQASQKLQAIRNELQTLQTEASNTGNSLRDRIGDALGSLDAKFGGIGAQLGGKLVAGFASIGVGALLADSVQRSWDAAGGLRRITGQFRLSAEEAGEYGRIAGKLYAENWGESLPEVQEVVALAGERLSDVTADTLDDITAQILAVTSTWGADYQSVIRSITQLTQNGLAPSSRAALDLIVTGFQDGADEAGDLLDTIDEYSQHWAAMGLSGEDALNQIVAGFQLGQRDADKLADAVKEMRLRATEDSEAVDEAYAALGLQADRTREKILEGGPAAREAFLAILEALKDVEDPIEQNTLAVALIGTQFEDLGPTAIDALTTVRGALRETQGAAEDLNNTVQATPWEQLRRDSEGWLLNLGNGLGRLLNPDLGGFADDFGQGLDKALEAGRRFSDESVRVAGRVRDSLGTGLSATFDMVRQAAARAADDFGTAGDRMVETAQVTSELVQSEFEGFVDEVNTIFAEAIETANAPLDELRDRLKNEKLFDRLAEQIAKVKEAPGDRDEVRELLDLVLNLGEAYEDIPRQKIVDIFTQIDRGQVDAALNEIQLLANQRQIRLQVTTGGTSFRIDPKGGAPEQIQTPTQINAVPNVTNNYFTISPEPSQVVGATNSNQFANGTRSRFQ